ncbi:MAG: orotate phosphoribosyltransferase [Rhodospirillaceae bacterium]
MSTASRTSDQRRTGQTVARILMEIGAVNFRPEDPYTLTSGWVSPVYIDCRKVISFPRARKEIIEHARQTIVRKIGFESLDAVAGGETAGIPYGAWLADSLELPMLYVRKKAKGFGRNAQIEGDPRPGQRVLLVEDLATDGASKINFVNALRAADLQCAHALVVFFYGVFPGALKLLEESGVTLHYLATWWDVLEAAEDGGYFSREAIQEVRAFLHDPVEWSLRHGGRGSEVAV